MTQEYFEPISWFKALLWTHIFNEDSGKRIRVPPELSHYPLRTVQYFTELFACTSKSNQFFHEHSNIFFYCRASQPKWRVIF